MVVLLISNYPLDHQQSMVRSAALLQAGLEKAGVTVVRAYPHPFFGGLFRGARLSKWLGYIDKFVLFPFLLLWKARRCDLVHIVDHSNAIYLFWLPAKKVAVTCNDLLAVRSALGEFRQNSTGFTGRLLQRWILAGLKRADLLIAISDASLADVRRLVRSDERRCARVYLPLGEAFRAELERKEKEITKLNLPSNRQNSVANRSSIAGHGNYILHVGGDVWYKNRDGVLRIFAELKKRMKSATPQLLMVGPPILGASEDIKFLQNRSDSEMVKLYNNARLLLFPSLAEGLGWPVAEAMACGCLVVTSKKAPLTEIGGDAGVYVTDPEDAISGAEIVYRLLTIEQSEKDALIVKGYEQAKNFADLQIIGAYIELYKEMLDGAAWK